jgi:hypothetical protein
MYARKANLTDLPDIFKIIDVHDFMYGVDINLSGVKDKIKENLQKSLETDIGNSVIVSIDNNEVTGVGLQIFGETAWVLSFCFTKLKEFNPINQKYGGIILGKMIELAEEKQYKEFYWIAREMKYSKKNKRLDIVLSMSDYAKKYIIETIEVIQPDTKTKLPKVEKYLLRNLNGLNKKPIAVKHGYLKK